MSTPTRAPGREIEASATSEGPHQCASGRAAMRSWTRERSMTCTAMRRRRARAVRRDARRHRRRRRRHPHMSMKHHECLHPAPRPRASRAPRTLAAPRTPRTRASACRASCNVSRARLCRAHRGVSHWRLNLVQREPKRHFRTRRRARRLESSRARRTHHAYCVSRLCGVISRIDVGAGASATGELRRRHGHARGL